MSDEELRIVHDEPSTIDATDIDWGQPPTNDAVGCPVCGRDACEDHVPGTTAPAPEDAQPVTFVPEPESRQVRRARERAERKHAERDPFPSTETGDAEFFVQVFAGRRAYDHQRRRWFCFDRHHWRADATEQVMQDAIAAIRQRQACALDVAEPDERKRRLRWTSAGESNSRIRHLLELASSHADVAIDGSEWDHDPLLLGVQTGVLDLRAGTLRAGHPADRITRVTPVPFDPEARCPRWDRFILEVCNDDEQLAAYLRRLIGYALTGATSEQAFWIFYGLGSNGKSTLLEVLTRHVIPEHSWTMSFPVAQWTESLSEYQRAELVGRRLVIAKESEQQKRLHTEFIKSLTGGDTVNARHPYGRPFTFIPSAKFILACNHRPIIRDDSHGMWRRVRLVPFSRTFEIDRGLIDVLQREAPGILRWAVDGCLAWQTHGLDVPTVVERATSDYAHESDTLASFISACCVTLDGATVRGGTFYAAYVNWCATSQIAEPDRLSARAVGERMKRSYRAEEGRYVTYFGVGLRPEERPEEEAS
jgi:putative DNA primase/helicase